MVAGLAGRPTHQLPELMEMQHQEVGRMVIVKGIVAGTDHMSKGTVAVVCHVTGDLNGSPMGSRTLERTLICYKYSHMSGRGPHQSHISPVLYTRAGVALPHCYRPHHRGTAENNLTSKPPSRIASLELAGRLAIHLKY